LDGLIDYVAADLAASTAHWKIVFTHYPFLGTNKRERPDEFYFQTLFPRLRQAGADLLITGHSHTYSWTYPLTGAEDANQDGTIEMDEVLFVAAEDHVYAKGDGLVQLVSGVGGGSLHHWDYSEPFVAEGYDEELTDVTADYGFAQVEVTPRQLTITYISGETGLIVGDLNGNGRADPGEESFGQFQIVDYSMTDGDVNQDGEMNVDDIDDLSAAVRAGLTDDRYDVNRDGSVNEDDRAALLDWYLLIRPGDSNLDGQFNSADLVLTFQAGQYEDRIVGNSGWGEGDWNGDGDFTSADMVMAFQTGLYEIGGAVASSDLAAAIEAVFAERNPRSRLQAYVA
jgi:hypothetical protein